MPSIAGVQSIDDLGGGITYGTVLFLLLKLLLLLWIGR